MINKDELIEIIELLSESSENAEDMYCKYNNSEYMLKEIDNTGWTDEGKYSSNYIIYALIKDDEDTEIRIGQDVTKWGSYYTDYEWTFGDIQQVKQEEVVIKKWVAIQ